MKYSEIFKEYLLSKEFESEISTLKQQKENNKYIKDYITINAILIPLLATIFFELLKWRGL